MERCGEGRRLSARRQGRVASVVTGELLPGLGASSGFGDHLVTQDQSCHGFVFPEKQGTGRPVQPANPEEAEGEAE